MSFRNLHSLKYFLQYKVYMMLTNKVTKDIKIAYKRVFVAEYQQHKEIKVQKSGYGKTGYKSCFLRK